MESDYDTVAKQAYGTLGSAPDLNKPSGPIASQMGRLSALLDVLGESVIDLEKTLESVLCPEITAPSAGTTEQTKNPTPIAGMTAQLMRYCARVEQIQVRMGILRQRVEL